MLQRWTGLQSQEDFFAVEKMTEQNAQAQAHQRDNQVAKAGGHGVVEKFSHVAAGQAQSEAIEADDVIGHVNGDRVHADPDERLAPFLIFPHIHHQEEESQQHCAVTAGHQHVRGGPDFFDDRELKIPKPAQRAAAAVYVGACGGSSEARGPQRLAG